MRGLARLQNDNRRQAQGAFQNLGVARLALVSSYDPNAYAVKVELQPTGTESGWLPIVSPWVGSGWGLFCPPTQGDQVLVVFQEGSLEAGICLGGLYSDVDRPLPCPSGEFWMVHQSASALKFTNDGKVSLVTQSDLNATVGGKLFASVTGDLDATVGGALNANVTGNATVTAPNISLNGAVGIVGGLTVDTLKVTSTTDLANGSGHFISTTAGPSATAKA